MLYIHHLPFCGMSGVTVSVMSHFCSSSIPDRWYRDLRAGSFLERREMGIFNVGGEGTVQAGDRVYRMKYKEALYLGRGDRKITFGSSDPASPARFYFCSAPAHTLVVHYPALAPEGLGRGLEVLARLLD